ncbi:MAG: hypothetical protein WHU10_03920 [Fimbriimonadales bacterium]
MGRSILLLLFALLAAVSLAGPGRSSGKKPTSAATVCTLGVVLETTVLSEDRYRTTTLDEVLEPGETVPILSHDGVVCRTVDSSGKDAFLPRSAVSLVKKLGRLEVLALVWKLEPASEDEATPEYQRWLRLYDRLAYQERGGELPPSQGYYDAWGDVTPTVEIHNGTQYRITVTYSGPAARSLTLSPGQSGTVRLPAGRYRVSASAHSASVRPFAGHEDLSAGYRYSVQFYIRTIRIR